MTPPRERARAVVVYLFLVWRQVPLICARDCLHGIFLADGYGRRVCGLLTRFVRRRESIAEIGSAVVLAATMMTAVGVAGVIIALLILIGMAMSRRGGDTAGRKNGDTSAALSATDAAPAFNIAILLSLGAVLVLEPLSLP